MKHAGKARQAALKIILWTLMALLVLIVGGAVAVAIGSLITAAAVSLTGLWILFALFVFAFFRDPKAAVPAGPEVIVSPAHGTVDVIDETAEPEFMGGACRRMSIFLSILDVHVQHTPVAGKIAFLKHSPGQFLNAMRTDCSLHNENVLVGFASSEQAGEKLAVRLIAGLLARRIVPWITLGETVNRGERISLIQFGSRVELCLPLSAQIQVRLGDRVKGGETVVATRKISG
ncbi:MAG: phosphatidylserine decarboxylase family protein [Chloroflexi bacterium]|nr:phosphatidylserine decarboxylase family protein [Chloroflexota bacterium]